MALAEIFDAASSEATSPLTTGAAVDAPLPSTAPPPEVPPHPASSMAAQPRTAMPARSLTMPALPALLRTSTMRPFLSGHVPAAYIWNIRLEGQDAPHHRVSTVLRTPVTDGLSSACAAPMLPSGPSIAESRALTHAAGSTPATSGMAKGQTLAHERVDVLVRGGGASPDGEPATPPQPMGHVRTVIAVSTVFSRELLHFRAVNIGESF